MRSYADLGGTRKNKFRLRGPTSLGKTRIAVILQGASAARRPHDEYIGEKEDEREVIKPEQVSSVSYP